MLESKEYKYGYKLLREGLEKDSFFEYLNNVKAFSTIEDVLFDAKGYIDIFSKNKDYVFYILIFRIHKDGYTKYIKYIKEEQYKFKDGQFYQLNLSNEKDLFN